MAIYSDNERSWINEGDLVFDIGSCVGEATDEYLKAGARVVAVEPRKDLIKHLKHKYKSNSKVIIIDKGVASKQGARLFMLSSDVRTLSTFSEEWKTGRFAACKWEKPTIVSVTTLDELIKQYGLPRFCKIDVEGYEYEVLKGLSKPIPYLSFEFASEFMYNAGRCIATLELLGYKRFNVGLAKDPNLLMKQWVSIEKLLSKMKDVSDGKTDYKHIPPQEARVLKDLSCLGGDIYAKAERL